MKNKKIYTILVALIFTINTLNLSAQTVDCGFKGGFNASTLLGGYSDNVKSSFISGINLGIFTVHKINETLSIQPELMFSQQGNKYSPYWKNRKNVLVVPVLLRYSSKLPVDLLAGPQFNLFDLKLALSLGAEYNIMKHLSSGARINLGISKDDGDHRDLVFQFYIAYKGLLDFKKIKILEPM
jgi:hypothetical protein